MALFLTTVISRTPLWVWAILAALLALGLHQARDHVLSRSRLLLQPLVLGGLSAMAAVGAFGPHPLTAAAWLLGAAAGVLLNQWLGLPRQVQALPDGRFAIGGSWAPLALLMLVFWLRYTLALALAMQPLLRTDAGFALPACAAYGLAVGLFGARAARVLRHGRAARLAAALAPPSPAHPPHARPSPTR